MQIATVKAQAREAGGRHANERLRRSGFVPAIIYGHGEKPEPVSLSQHDLEMALGHLQHVLQLDVSGKQAQYLLKDVQYDHLQKTPLHVDLMRVDPNERVQVTVSVQLRGIPKGIQGGGELLHMINDLKIECPLLAIPDTIIVRVENLDIGQALHVRDVALPEGVTALHDAEETVASVRLKRIAAEAAAGVVVEGDASKEPEVIGRVAKETEGEEE